MSPIALLHADFSVPVLITPAQQHWVASPQAGVERVMLDRIDGEQARATSLVRYAPAASFPAHAHAGGEEILVIFGTFADEDGDYPAGSYLRNPPGSRHRPSAPDGATIFVKLGQMTAHEHRPLRVDTRESARWRSAAGRLECLLYEDESERVSLRRLAPGESLFDGLLPGAEVLVLTGSLRYRDRRSCSAVTGSGATGPREGFGEGALLHGGSWLRWPAGQPPLLHGAEDGATVYVKAGALGQRHESFQ